MIWHRIPMAAWWPIAAVLFGSVVGLRAAWRKLRDGAAFGCILFGAALVYAGVAYAAWVAGVLWLSCVVASVLPLLLLVAGIRWAYSRRQVRRYAVEEPWTTDEQAMLDGRAWMPW